MSTASIVVLVSVLATLASTQSAVGAEGAGAVQRCRHRFHGPGRRKEAARRRCVKAARTKPAESSPAPEAPRPASAPAPSSGAGGSATGTPAPPGGAGSGKGGTEAAAPETSIVGAPTGTVASPYARLSFSSDQSTASFDCRLDGAPFSLCASPVDVGPLTDGPHSFQVRASVDGLVDPTPASATWEVDTSPPDTVISSAPAAEAAGAVEIRFAGSDPDDTFACRLDDGVFEPCSSPFGMSDPPAGMHEFQVKATDPAGNTDPTAARASWTELAPGDPAPLDIVTRRLHDGVAGLPYQDRIEASGGTGPYEFEISGLPAGINANERGLVSGTPEKIGSGELQVEVTDAEGRTSEGLVSLPVTTSLPTQCIERSCAELSPDGQTVEVDGSRVLSVSRAEDGGVDGLRLEGAAPSEGQIVVVSRSGVLPSGLVALVKKATGVGGGQTDLTVESATLGDAYSSGTVHALGSPGGPGADPGTEPAVQMAARTLSSNVGTASLHCDGGVSSDLHGLSVKPSLTPSMAAIWKHPLFGGSGIYPGVGGLKLFQFDLDGQIEVNLGVKVSGAATCTLQLPRIVQVVPAGDLGAILMETAPTVSLKTTGKVDARATATLSCGTEYRWDEGQSYRQSYCGDRYTPLRLASDSGADVTASGELAETISLDDIVGVRGSVDADLHGSYAPTGHPVAELDAGAEYDLGGCLLCFWKGAPTQVQIAHGTIFHKTLATYDSAPPAPDGGGSGESSAIGTPASLPPDAYVTGVYPSSTDRFLAVFTGQSDNDSYLGYLGPGGSRPTSVLSVPTTVNDVTFAPDGTLFATLGSLASFEGGELVRIPGELTGAQQIHSWGVGPNGYLRSPGPVVYLGGRLYVEANTPNAWFSCQDLLTEMTLAGEDIASTVPPVDCGGWYDVANGQLSIWDEGFGDVSWLDPVTLEPVAGRSLTSDGYLWGLAEGADGSYAVAAGEHEGCPDLTVGELSLSGVLYEAPLTTVLGLHASDACGYGGVADTTNGDLEVAATDSQGLVLATIHGGTVGRTVIGPTDAEKVEILADGSGGVVVVYRRSVECEGPGEDNEACSETVVLYWRAGVATRLASYGGTYENSVTEIRPPVVVDGKILLTTLAGPFNESEERFFVAGGSAVGRQSWHDPGA